MLTGLAVFAAAVAIDQGLAWAILKADRSRLCILIALLYLGTTLHCAWHTWLTSVQLNRVRDLSRGGIRGLSKDLPSGLSDVTQPESLVLGAFVDFGTAAGRIQAGERLLEAYAARIRGPIEFGWFMVDIELKLGLLGTVVGFILLGALTQTTQFDLGTMQKLLTQMSAGMGTALYTTFVGLIASMLLGVQYHLLDRAADELILRLVWLTETAAGRQTG
jgi:hypothetical protein